MTTRSPDPLLNPAAALRAGIDSALDDAEAARAARDFKDATAKAYEAFGLNRALTRLERPRRLTLIGIPVPAILPSRGTDRAVSGTYSFVAKRAS